MEVNSSPGLEGIERTTGVDVAAAIVEYVEERVLFPDMDIRQRLSLSKGYGVAEIPVAKKCELAGKTLVDSGLREKDITVLTLHRDGKILANPLPSRDIQVGDRLVCFGKIETMKTLLPPRKKRRPRRRLAAPPAAKAADSPPND